MYIHGAAVVEDGADGRGQRAATLLEGTEVVHHRGAAVVGGAEILGYDAQPAARGLIVKRRAARNRQNPRTNVAYAVVRIAGVQVDLNLRSRCRAAAAKLQRAPRSEEHTSELQSHSDLVCRL